MLCGLFAAGEIREIRIVYTRFVSMLSQTPEVLPVLPFPQPEPGTKNAHSMVVYEPDGRTVFDAVIPEYLAGVVYGALCESVSSELAARRTAMDSASKNASDMIEHLSLNYNRARQAAHHAGNHRRLWPAPMRAVCKKENPLCQNKPSAMWCRSWGLWLDIRFPEGRLPALLNAIRLDNHGTPLIAEVAQQIGDNVVRCIAMSSTDGHGPRRPGGGHRRSHHRAGGGKMPGAGVQPAGSAH